MAGEKPSAPGDCRPAAAVVIRHQNGWQEGRHDMAFLQPLVIGTLKRLTESDPQERFICK